MKVYKYCCTCGNNVFSNRVFKAEILHYGGEYTISMALVL